MAITKTWDNNITVNDYGNNNLLNERAKTIYEGLSTDNKPTDDVRVNDEFKELDTGKWYYFDGSAWQEGVGGSSGSGAEVTVVTLSNLTIVTPTIATATPSISLAEIYAKSQNGPVFCKLDATSLGQGIFMVPLDEFLFEDGEIHHINGKHIIMDSESPTVLSYWQISINTAQADIYICS